MMPVGLTFDEYVDLEIKPLKHADPVFHAVAKEERERIFPMATIVASGHLRSRGYDSRPQMLDLLVKSGTIKLAQPDTWTQADVEAAAVYFEEGAMFTPYAAMCETLGCRYADFLRSLREAAERESAKYGRPVPSDDQYFVMHRVPPRGVANADGDLVGTKPAVISFTLCDDIRERIERGEEI